MHVPQHRKPVRPLLIEYGFECVRHGGGDKRREQDVIAGLADIRLLSSCVDPPGQRQCAKHVFVCTPRQRLCNVFERAARVRCNAVRYRNVGVGGLYAN
jgi:hypothetical protein